MFVMIGIIEDVENRELNEATARCPACGRVRQSPAVKAVLVPKESSWEGSSPGHMLHTSALQAHTTGYGLCTERSCSEAWESLPSSEFALTKHRVRCFSLHTDCRRRLGGKHVLGGEVSPR